MEALDRINRMNKIKSFGTGLGRCVPFLSILPNFQTGSMGKPHQTASGMVSIFPKSFRSSILPHLDLFNFAFRDYGADLAGLGGFHPLHRIKALVSTCWTGLLHYFEGSETLRGDHFFLAGCRNGLGSD